MDCLNTSWMHFRDNMHTLLAESRAHQHQEEEEEDGNSDVQLLNVEPMQHRLETVLEAASEVSSPIIKSPAKDNPFLCSDSESEDDIFKEYDVVSKDNGEKVNEEQDTTNQGENHDTRDEDELVEPEKEVEESEEEEVEDQEEEAEDDFIGPEEEVQEPDFVVPDAGQTEVEREIVPCIAGVCDKDKQSVTVSVNGEAVKVINLNFAVLFTCLPLIL